MSILLDALKKAEARKRQEAAQDGEPTGPAPLAPTAGEPPTPVSAPAASSSLSLEPMTEASPPAAAVPAPSDSAPASPTTPPATRTLELTPVETPAPAPPPPSTPPAVHEPLTVSEVTPPVTAPHEPAEPDKPLIEPMAPRVETSVEGKSDRHVSGSPSAATPSPTSIAPPVTTASASTPAPSRDAGTVRASAPASRAPADETRAPPTVAPQPSADKPGSGQPAGEKAAADTRPSVATDNEAGRRQAQTVLAAPRVKAASGSRRRWVLMSAGVGALLLLGGGALFLRQLGVPPFGTPASLVGNLPPPSSAPADASVETPPAASDSAADPNSAADAASTAALAGAGESGTAAAMPPMNTAPVAAEADQRVEPAAAVARDVSNDPAIDDTPAPPARSALATPVDELQWRREPLRVQRRSAPSQLNAAYAALQAGRLDEAEAAYRDTLNAQPGELDAMLGLAVIAERRGDRASAEGYYRRVLSQQPDHPQAMAALLSVSGPPQGEDEYRLRQSLAEHPDSAMLHAAMGQRMATQQRWADAQAAYFEAVAREPGNADHLYNLAVALDHLQQPRVAADYYRRALAQPDPSSRFDRRAAMQRLAALDAAGTDR